MSHPEKFYPKELSWLAFNQRVLQEAADRNNPIIERIRFLGIYSNNLDEFFRVRVADVKRQIMIHMNAGDDERADYSKELLEQIQQKVQDLSVEFEAIYQDVVAKLARYNVVMVNPLNLSDYQRNWLQGFFKNKVLRHVAPLLLHSKIELEKRLHDTTSYLLIAIHKDDQETRYAVIEVPVQALGRFIEIPPEKSRKKRHIMLLDDIIKQCLPSIFRGFVEFDSLEAYSFKMTRDSEYSINDEIDESYVEKMTESMKQRLRAEPVRVNYDGAMPKDMLKVLKKRLKMSSYDSMIAGGPYRNFRDFIGFPNVGRDYLENHPLPALTANAFERCDTIFEAIRRQDILLYYPFHRFLHFSEFLRQAAFDPAVKHIRINIYRVAKSSRIMSSLIDAVDNGKLVTVVVELRARFDEEANIDWSKKLTDAGVRVILGPQSLKIHSKLCVVSREEQGEIRHYAHFGTGNFNEKTAKIYTDFSLFTCNQALAQEGINVFDMIQNPYKRQWFDLLHVSPLNNRIRLVGLIRNEVVNAKAGRKAAITLKLNNLEDATMIEELYAASQAGVKIRMIIRGICCLRPGIKGLSENISVISIVDRYLEHPRVLVFENGGDPKVYISSADWMTRNLDGRIEVGCPILEPVLQKRIIDILELQFKDTMKARVIDAEQSNRYVPRGNRRKIQSQVAIYNYLTELERHIAIEQATEQEPHDPAG